MMWVRFPNGQCIRYNDATYLTHDTNCRRLWPNKAAKVANRNCIAILPLDCIVELTFACAVTNPTTEPKDDVAKELKALRRLVNKALKK